MPVYRLIKEPVFPDPEEATPEGLLAVGGDLSPKRLIAAYANGIFPWYAEGEPIMWWSLDPRMVLFPNDFKRHKSLRRVVSKGVFRVTFDKDFDTVIDWCGKLRATGADGTWITKDMKKAFGALHRLGLAHSVEVWQNGIIAGGLYGVSLGGTFFGESMFHLVRDASKVALWHLVDRLLEWDFDMIDAQQATVHLAGLGAKSIPRKKFLTLLRKSLEKPIRRGDWGNYQKDN